LILKWRQDREHNPLKEEKEDEEEEGEKKKKKSECKSGQFHHRNAILASSEYCIS
jgi:hypothetical protein